MQQDLERVGEAKRLEEKVERERGGVRLQSEQSAAKVRAGEDELTRLQPAAAGSSGLAPIAVP